MSPSSLWSNSTCRPMQMPRNGTRRRCTRVGERVDQVLVGERVEGGAGGADAGQDDALGGRDLVGVPTRRHGSPRCSSAYSTLGALPGAVVDDVDHARPRVANRLTVAFAQSEPPDPSDEPRRCLPRVIASRSPGPGRARTPSLRCSPLRRSPRPSPRRTSPAAVRPHARSPPPPPPRSTGRCRPGRPLSPMLGGIAPAARRRDSLDGSAAICSA